MDQNLLNNFDESIKSKYANKLYRTCYEMNEDDDSSCGIKMSTCLNLRPKNNFRMLENLVENDKYKKNRPNTDKNNRYNSATSNEIKDYKKLLVLKQKIQNSFRSKNNPKNNKSVFIDLKVPAISSSAINSLAPTPASVKTLTAKSAEINENFNNNVDKLTKNQRQIRNGNILLNSRYLKKKIQLNQRNQEQTTSNSEQKESKTLDAKNILNSSADVYAVNGNNGNDYGEDEEEANHAEINSTDSDESSLIKQSNNNSYDLDCLRSICDTNKIYLKKLYNNFDIPILYCDSENQFKTEHSDEKNESQEFEGHDRPLLKMNPIQFNYKNIRQPRSIIQQTNRNKKPHWVNIATVGKINEVRKPTKNETNKRITSHLVAQKTEPSLVFVSTFSSMSTLSEYMKNKKPEEQHDQNPRKKSLGKIHSEQVYSDCLLKSKSAVVSPTSYYSANNLNSMDDDNQLKCSFSDLQQCKLPDLMTAPKLYVLNNNALNIQDQKSKQSFITQTQVYKKLSELQRQNTFEYLKFVSVKNLKDQNDQNVKSNSTSKFVAPKISKKIVINETQAENIERQKQKIVKNCRSIKRKRSSIRTKMEEKLEHRNNTSTRSSSTTSQDMEMNDLKTGQEEEHYEEDEDDDEDHEPDFVITQNSKLDQINEPEIVQDFEPKLNKTQYLYTHVLTSSSQLREFYHYSSAINSNKNLNLVLRNSFSNAQFKDAWEFMYNERKVRKLHQKVVENLEKQRSSSDIRLINFISSNLNYNNRSNFDCYKFYERSKTSNLLQNLKHKLYEQVTLASRLNREQTQLNNSELLDKSINLSNSYLP